MNRATMARALAVGVLAGAAVPMAAQEGGALAQLRAGEWQVHEIGSRAPARAMCVHEPRLLLQLEHPGATCTFRTISADADAATVRYTCPGVGNGMTDVTVESRTIVRLHTQGVRRGAPFDVAYEARFAGPCGAGLAAR